MQTLSVKDLEKKYNDAVTIDQSDYDEKRTNILIRAGFHYSKRNNSYYNKLRDSHAVTDDMKLRITKNHLGKIMNIYENNLLVYCPGTTIVPKDERNIHDKVQADLSRSIWDDGKYRCNYNKKRRETISDLFTEGETWMKILYDPDLGDLIGYQGSTDENQQPIMDEYGIEKPDLTMPVFEGDIKSEIFKGHDAFYDKDALSVDESPFIGLKKLVPTDELKEQIKSDKNIKEEDKNDYITAITNSSMDNFTAFTGVDGIGSSKENRTLLKEYWYRPSPVYPRGYFYIATNSKILWQGELQTDKFGKPVYPIIYCFCDEFTTARRGSSPMRQGRPVQAEINRTSSKIAETQVTLGDDKIVREAGSGVTEGAKLNGMREIIIEGGGKYEVFPGRGGEQYLPYLQNQITELYNIMGVAEDSAEQPEGQDIVASLFKSLKNKKKFMLYAEKYERFLCEWTKIYIALAKKYFREDRVIKGVGTVEAINIAEFKRTDDSVYDIKVMPQVDDVETMLGKYLVLTNTMQYGSVDQETLGRMMEEMPFINKSIFGHLTTDYMESRNICLALDRGEMPTISQFDNNEKIVQALVRRMREADFQYIVNKNPKVYENYLTQYKERVANINQVMQQLKDANAGIIPTGGPQVRVDLYVEDPSDPLKTKRASVPMNSMEWFLERLGTQGATMETISAGTKKEQIDELAGKTAAPQSPQGNQAPQAQGGI